MSVTKPLRGPVVECVPNFSEGRRPQVIKAIMNEIDTVSGVKVLDLHSDPDHNRSVITFIGKPDRVVEAAIASVRAAARLIDLRKHKGVHPRIGATDVIPIIPIRDICMPDCIEIARELAKRIWFELDIPTYLYGFAALREDRTHLEKVRLKGFEQMRTLVKRDKKRRPDFGEARLHPTAGATIVGAREPLIAFNVNLKSTNLKVAEEIAEEIREKNSGLKGLKALGLRLDELKCVQVSTNITRTEIVSPYAVFDIAREKAAERGISVRNCELVGLMPLHSVMMTNMESMKLDSFDSSRVVELNL